ncbi:radical SAM protein [Candidatus Woesearchaeota archaeon]|nr:radical SAM protein [Candidatus Woesearchaeota archaeon]
MIKKVALISPLDSYRAYGLRLVSSYLRKNKIETKLIFLTTYSEMWQLFFRQSFSEYSNNIIKQINSIIKECDLIGITMMSMDRKRVASLYKSLKKLKKPIILGGIHPTIFPEDAIKISGLINIGEGFDSLLEYCREPTRTNIQNIWSMNQNGKIIKNKIRPVIQNIDNMPFPDYGISHQFILKKNKIIRVDKKIRRKLIGSVYHIFASLGCPYSCSYCVNSKYKQIGKGYEKFRFHSVNYIIDEIKYALSLSRDIRYINFSDDGFIAMKEETLEQFAKIYKKEIKIPFGIMGFMPSFVTKKKLDILVNAGMKRTRMGIQSADLKTLKLYRRPTNISKIIEVNDMINSYNNLVFPYYDIIMDNPLVNNEEDLLSTIKFLLNLKGKFTLFLYSLRFYPGTELYNKAKELNLLEKYYNDSMFNPNYKLLNYILTVIQSTQNKTLSRILLKVYNKKGNIKIPKMLFTINQILFLLRCGIEHIRKQDVSGLPKVVANILVPKKDNTSINTVKSSILTSIP